jgi:ATP adenylyltransferase
MDDAYFFNFDKLAYVKGKRPDGCILCGIRDHDPLVADLTVYRNDRVIVSVNLYPYNPGHLIVFPARHLRDIRDLDSEERDDIDRTVRLMLDTVEGTHNPKAFNVGVNMGRFAGASIEHLHYHVIPRYPAELGIADLIGGRRVLVEDPRDTCDRLKRALEQSGVDISLIGNPLQDHQEPS